MALNIKIPEGKTIKLEQDASFENFLGQFQLYSSKLLCVINGNTLVFFEKKDTLPKNIRYNYKLKRELFTEYYFTDISDQNIYCVFGREAAKIFFGRIDEIDPLGVSEITTKPPVSNNQSINSIISDNSNITNNHNQLINSSISNNSNITNNHNQLIDSGIANNSNITNNHVINNNKNSSSMIKYNRNDKLSIISKLNKDALYSKNTRDDVKKIHPTKISPTFSDSFVDFSTNNDIITKIVTSDIAIIDNDNDTELIFPSTNCLVEITVHNPI